MLDGYVYTYQSSVPVVQWYCIGKNLILKAPEGELVSYFPYVCECLAVSLRCTNVVIMKVGNL